MPQSPETEVEYVEMQAEKRRDDVLRRMLSTDPKPHTMSAKKAAKKPQK